MKEKLTRRKFLTAGSLVFAHLLFRKAIPSEKAPTAENLQTTFDQLMALLSTKRKSAEPNAPPRIQNIPNALIRN